MDCVTTCQNAGVALQDVILHADMMSLFFFQVTVFKANVCICVAA